MWFFFLTSRRGGKVQSFTSKRKVIQEIITSTEGAKLSSRFVPLLTE